MSTALHFLFQSSPKPFFSFRQPWRCGPTPWISQTRHSIWFDNSLLVFFGGFFFYLILLLRSGRWLDGVGSGAGGSGRVSMNDIPRRKRREPTPKSPYSAAADATAARPRPSPRVPASQSRGLSLFFLSLSLSLLYSLVFLSFSLCFPFPYPSPTSRTLRKTKRRNSKKKVKKQKKTGRQWDRPLTRRLIIDEDRTSEPSQVRWNITRNSSVDRHIKEWKGPTPWRKGRKRIYTNIYLLWKKYEEGERER